MLHRGVDCLGHPVSPAGVCLALGLPASPATVGRAIPGTAPPHPGEKGRAGDRSLAPARPCRIWLGLLLLIPGGLLIALGVLAAWPGLALLVSGARRMTAASRSTQDVDVAAVATLSSGSGQRVGTPVTGSPQPYGQPCQPSPRWGVN